LTHGAAPAAAQQADPAWGALLDGLPHAAWVVRVADQSVAAANAEAGALFGCPPAQLVGASALMLATSPEDMAYWDACAAGEADALLSDTVVLTHDGRELHASRSIRPLGALANGQPAQHALVMLRDRSVEARAERERESVVAELQATLESTADGILVTDLKGGIRAFNRRFAQIWGLPLDLLQRHDDAAVHAWLAGSVVDTADYERRLQTLQEATLLHATDRLRLHSGQIVERVTRPLHGDGGSQGRVWSFRDLTERIAADQRIEALTYTDALTGLPNRRRLAGRFTEVAATSRSGGHAFALLVIDLDRFREINDTLGHDVGDRVLLDIAQRMQGCLRQQDMLARIGGDQFAVIVSPADAQTAETSARRLLNVVAQPCNVDGAQFTLTCSIGMALCPAHGSTIDDLVRHAESAMRAVKQAGRSNYRLHQVRAEGDRRSNMRLDHAMRQALVSNRFRLHYQPQVRLRDGAMMGAEALLRWRDPEMGEVPPGRFIPVAEDSGFIVALGDWVLSQAVRQAALWHQRGYSVPMAVNVSALQFQQAQFVDRVAGVLAVSGLPPHLLELELTESILVHDAADALLRLGALSNLGVRLSIDDFGTGYSSLAYLKRFPIHKLKIDRSFVSGLPSDESDAGIVRAILQMAKALGMHVIAEGVETAAQHAFLLDAGCDQFQGFFCAPALDSMSFEQRLVAQRAPQADTLPRATRPHMRLVQK
jgi:diguanylate cyclase (GGDEF)-like protein/PAS domain S-box-containing protein